MKLMSLTVIVFASLFASSCTKKQLDRETATKLVQGHGLSVEGSFWVLNSGEQERFYQQLMAGGVIVCQPGSECAPGPNGSGVSRGNEGDLIFVAGSLMPVEVTGVTKTGETSAAADVRLTFQPTPTYARFQQAFDQLDGHLNNGRTPLRQLKQRSTVHATFQLYDDGWRFQSIQW